MTFVRKAGISLDRLNDAFLMAVVRRLYIAAGCLYVLSFLARTVLMSLVYSPELSRFSRPLASILQFVSSELQGLLAPFFVTIPLVAAVVLQSARAYLLKQEESEKE